MVLRGRGLHVACYGLRLRSILGFAIFSFCFWRGEGSKVLGCSVEFG